MWRDYRLADWAIARRLAFLQALEMTSQQEADLMLQEHWRRRPDSREIADRRKAERRQRVSDALEGWEACRRREDRRRNLDNVRIAHWIARFTAARVNAQMPRGDGD